MPSDESHSRRRYPLIYRIYRRLRYVLFLRRKRKRLATELRRKEKLDARAVRASEKKRIRLEKKLAREKLRYEKEQQRKARREMEKNIRENRQKLRTSEQALNEIIQEQEKIDKAERKRKRKRLLRFWIRIQLRKSWQGLRSFNAQTVRDWYAGFKKKSRSRKKLLIILANSATYSLLAYFIIYLVHQVAMIITASFFHFPATLYYNEIYFHITADDWTADAVKTIYLSGPLAVILVGFLFYLLYHQLKELEVPFKVFFLWGSLHASAFLFGGALIGSLFETGMGYAISWMYIMDTGKVFTSIVALFFLFVAGMALRQPFFFSANAYFNSLTSHNRQQFLAAQVLFPYLLVNLVIFIIRLPGFMFYETLILVTAFISLLPVILTTEDTLDLYFEEEEKRSRIDWKTMIAALLLVVFYRFLLEAGIRFG